MRPEPTYPRSNQMKFVYCPTCKQLMRLYSQEVEHLKRHAREAAYANTNPAGRAHGQATLD